MIPNVKAAQATLLLIFVYATAVDGSEEEAASNATEQRYQVITWQWHEVQTPYTIGLWILLASIAKIGFKISTRVSEMFPDSSLLIVLGLLVGIILYFVKTDVHAFTLDSQIFFLYLLPPIVFDAGYYMPNRAFFDNIGTILVYAVLGTLWNVLTIGLSLWAVSQANVFSASTPLLHMLLFASLISAVDPVAVLVVFEEVHVNEILYITVFGESLLNDAVTVVLYNMFLSFSNIGAANLQPIDGVAGFISFFVVGLGGVAIGIVWALVVSFTTKYTENVKILNPLIVFVMPYLAYLSAECLKLSSILAIVFCGIVMKQWVKENISNKAQTTVRYLVKMLSNVSETIIFMFLGLSTVGSKHHWDTAFVALTVLFCLVYRAIGVVLQTFFLNKWRLNKFNRVEQFIMAYGGLRGAIAYGLVVALPSSIEAKEMFVTATIVVIYFTVFLQGMTIKPLVNFLKVEKAEKRQKSMNENIMERMLDHFMAGLEDLCGHYGHHWFRDKYEQINAKYIRPILIRNAVKTQRDTKIMKSFSRITMKEALDIVKGRETSESLAVIMRRQNSQLSLAPSRSETNLAAAEYNNPAFEDGEAGAKDGKRPETPQRFDFDSMWIPIAQHHNYARRDADLDSSSLDLNKMEKVAHKRLRKMASTTKPPQQFLDVHRPRFNSEGPRKTVKFDVQTEELNFSQPNQTSRNQNLPTIRVDSADDDDDDSTSSLHPVFALELDTDAPNGEVTTAEEELPWKRTAQDAPITSKPFVGEIEDTDRQEAVVHIQINDDP